MFGCTYSVVMNATKPHEWMCITPDKARERNLKARIGSTHAQCSARTIFIIKCIKFFRTVLKWQSFLHICVQTINNLINLWVWSPCKCLHGETTNQEIQQYFLSRDGPGSKWLPVHEIQEQPLEKQRRHAKSLQTTSLCCSIAKPTM